MERMSAMNMVTAHRKKRRRREIEPQMDVAKEQKSLEEIRVEQGGPSLFGEGSWGPCTGGKGGPYDP